jgi:hypothetical protein
LQPILFHEKNRKLDLTTCLAFNWPRLTPKWVCSLDCAGRAKRRRRFPSDRRIIFDWKPFWLAESGVALRFPPRSKTPPAWSTLFMRLRMSSLFADRRGGLTDTLLSGLWFALISVILSACGRPTETLSPGQREAIQARVAARFDITVLFKPADSASNNTIAVRLAPLIIQEVADTNVASLWRDQFDSGDSGLLVVSESGTIVVNGRSRDQLSYSWTYAASAPPTKSERKSQGVRLTLNAAGEPVIWEVLADSSGAVIIYVAQSLELAARAEFGPPLAGRKFSLELSLADAPNAVVASVIDDGPTPMGPVVYLRKESRDVSTLICRCMASQGGILLGQTNYELHLNPPQTNGPSAFPPVYLEQRLRLPRSF